MAISYATKYEKRVDERFSKKSLAEAFTNMDYDWQGVDTIKVYSIPTVAMNDYTLTGSTRFGVAGELQNTVQTMLLAKDRAFTFTIDRKSEDDTQGAMDAQKALKRQVDEIIVPEIDTYTFGKMVAASIANSNYDITAVDATNAYSLFLTAQESLDNDLVPETGRKAACTPAFYKFIKLDDSFMLASEVAMGKRINGQVGEIDGVAIVKAPAVRLGTGVAFILAHPVATVMAKKLTMYRVLPEVPGIDGKLVEGRVRYDAFVLDSKKNAIFTHFTSAPTV